MKDIKNLFEKVKQTLNADGYGYSDLIIFGRLIRNKNLKNDFINKWFEKLVDKSDWKGTPKKEVLDHLKKLNVGFYETKNGLK